MRYLVLSLFTAFVVVTVISCSAVTGKSKAADPQTGSSTQTCLDINGVNVCPTRQVVGGKKYLTIGDMKFNALRVKAKSGFRGANSFAQGYQTAFWPADADGRVTIPYTIQSSTLNTLVPRALLDLQTRSGVRFVPRTTEQNYITYIEVVPQAGDTFVTCGLSDVGMVGQLPGAADGQQTIELSQVSACKNAITGDIFPTVQHETEHALGFFHEHQRTDRDDHIRVHLDYLDPACASQYAKIAYSDGVGPYDVRSVMHYESKVCSLYSDLDVMQAETQELTDAMGHAPKATDSDIAGIIAVYGPGSRVAISSDQTSANFTYITATAMPSRIKYGRFPDEINVVAEDRTPVTSHVLTIPNLLPGKRYYYQIETADGVFTPYRSFVTDNTAPVISNFHYTLDNQRTMEATFTTNKPTMGMLLVCADPKCEGDNIYSFNDLPYFGTIQDFLVGLSADVFYVIGYAEDAAGNASYSDTFKVDADNAPPVISKVIVSNRSVSGATIAWTTDDHSTSVVNYGTTTALGSTVNSGDLRKAHSVTLSGLAANSTYYFTVTSANAKGQTSTSLQGSFSTDVTPPTLSAIVVTNLTISGARISWATDKNSNSVVKYGLSSSDLTSNLSDDTLVTSHSIAVPGLTADTTYFYQVFAQDASLNQGSSTVLSFTTAANVPPVISNLQSTQGVNRVTVTWNTDVLASSVVKYGASSGSYTQTVTDSSLTSTHSAVLTGGLVANSTYYYKVYSKSAVGAIGVSAEQSFIYVPTDTITSLLLFNDYYVPVPRYVYTQSNQSGVTMTMKIRRVSDNEIEATVGMTYVFAGGAWRYYAEIPAYYLGVGVGNGTYKVHVESSGGGSREN